MPLTKEKFLRYADLKMQIKTMTEEMELLGSELQTEMEEVGAQAKISIEQGSFSFMKKKKWTYSENVGQKEAELKDLKKSEQQDGSASFEEELVMQFRAKYDKSSSDQGGVEVEK